MSLLIDWRYLDAAAFQNLTEYFRKFEVAVTMNAEEGSTGASTVTLHDPDAVLDIVGLSHFRVYEDTAPAGEQCIGQYYAAESTIRRGDSELVTEQRVWDVNLIDINTILSYRVFDKETADRPAETDVARLQWLLSTTQMTLVDDSRYLDATGPVAMDAVNYVGQTPQSVIDDCAQSSGKNWFLWYAEDADDYSLWYAHAISSNYSSAIKLSNVLADVDSSTVFALSQDTVLKRDPSRVYSGVYLPYDGGAVYSRSVSTASNYPQRDFVAPAANVKTEAKALARARRYLSDLASEEDVITTTIILPRAQVNDLMQGMRVQVKASHLPGYASYVWMRALNRTVKEYNEDEYAITLELVAPAPRAATCPSPTPAGTYYPLGGSGSTPNVSDGVTYYLRPGITYPTEPTVGHQGAWHFPVFGAGGSGTVDYAGDCSQNRVRVIVSGDGTLVLDTASYLAVSRNLNARLMHADASALHGYVVDESQTGQTGDSFTFAVTSHGGVNCVHWVDIIDTGPECGSKWGYSGAAWTLSG